MKTFGQLYRYNINGVEVNEPSNYRSSQDKIDKIALAMLLFS